VYPCLATAQDQQTDADFSAYCRANYSNSAYQKFVQNWGTEHACVQGGTRQFIDFTAACRNTTGSSEYEILGDRVLCAGSHADKPPEDVADLGEPDLSTYCTDHFPGSSYKKRAEPTGYHHYCRRPGLLSGYMLQPINLQLACEADYGTREFRKSGAQLICTLEQPTADNDVEIPAAETVLPAPSTEPQPFDTTKVEPTPLPDAPLFEPNPDESPSAEPSRETTNADVATFCQALGGAWRSATLEIVENIMSSSEQLTQMRLPSCETLPTGREHCRDQIMVEQSIQSYFQINSIYQCHFHFVQNQSGKTREDLRTAGAEGCAIQGTLDDLATRIDEVTGTMANPPHRALLGRDDTVDPCDICILPAAEDVIAMLEEILQRDLTAANRKMVDLLNSDPETVDDDDAFFQIPQDPPKHGTERTIRLAALATNTTTIPEFFAPLILVQVVVAPDASVTDKTGPLPGYSFIKNKTGETSFGKYRSIRDTTQEMSDNAGRDTYLQHRPWQDFLRQKATVIEALDAAYRETDPHKRKAFFELAELSYDGLRQTHRELVERRGKLRGMQRDLDRQFETPTIKNFVNKLKNRIKRNRQFERDYGKMGKTLGSWMNKISDRLKGKVGQGYLAIIKDLDAIAKDLKTISDTLDEDRVIRDKRGYFMDLLEMEGALELLLAQYDARIDAENEFLDRLEETILERAGPCD